MPGANKGALVAEGAYTYHRGDASTGHEAWRLEKLAHGGMTFESEIDLTAPAARQIQFTYEVTQQWAPVRVGLKIEGEGQFRTAEHRVVGGSWQATLETHGDKPTESAVAFGVKTEIEFLSPVFATPSLYRLNLQVGKSVTADVIAIDAASLAPAAVKRTIRCVGEEKTEVPAGKYSAWHYSIQTEGAAGEDQFWADRNGVVLLFQTAGGDSIKLARYRRIDRR